MEKPLCTRRTKRRDGIVALDVASGNPTQLTERRRSQRRAAMVTGWKANRFYFDAVQQAISYFRADVANGNSKMWCG